tara:strand:+ start:1122 stop:1244 length:123 start_codon:yes stop_codon:yes gene_type:complete
MTGQVTRLQNVKPNIAVFLGVFGRWFWIVFPYDIEIYLEF